MCDLTKREQFAMAAMTGIIAGMPTNVNDYVAQLKMWKLQYGNITVKEAIAKDSVNIADATISEIDRTEPEPIINQMYKEADNV